MMFNQIVLLVLWSTMIINAKDIQERSGWNSYIDNLIAQSIDGQGVASVDKATIIGLDGGAEWVSAANNVIKLTGSEGSVIAHAFKSQDFTTFMSNGVYVGGIKYQFLREEDSKIVLAKKNDNGAITMQSSKTAVIIGHTIEGQAQGNSNKAVAVIAEYLESLGY